MVHQDRMSKGDFKSEQVQFISNEPDESTAYDSDA